MQGREGKNIRVEGGGEWCIENLNKVYRESNI